MKKSLFVLLLGIYLPFNHILAKSFFIVKFDPTGNLLASTTCSIGNSAGLAFSEITNLQVTVSITNSNGFFVEGMQEIYRDSSDVSITLTPGLQYTAVLPGKIAEPQSSVYNDVGEQYTISHFAGILQLQGTNLQSVGENDIVLLKYTAEGEIVWAVTFGSSEDDLGCSIALDPDGNIYVTGHLGVDGEVDSTTLQTFTAEIYPNPTDGILQYEVSETNLLVQVSDMNGQNVYQTTIKNLTGSIQLPELTTGLYYISFYSAETNAVVIRRFAYVHQ